MIVRNKEDKKGNDVVTWEYLAAWTSRLPLVIGKGNYKQEERLLPV